MNIARTPAVSSATLDKCEIYFAVTYFCLVSRYSLPSCAGDEKIMELVFRCCRSRSYSLRKSNTNSTMYKHTRVLWLWNYWHSHTLIVSIVWMPLLLVLSFPPEPTRPRTNRRCRGNSNSSRRQWSMVVCRCGDTVSTFKDLLLFYCQKFSLLESLAVLHANIHVDILYVFTLCHCISVFWLPLYPTRCTSSDMFALIRVWFLDTHTARHAVLA